jgi:nucleoside-diphosphate-sugar epimerase
MSPTVAVTGATGFIGRHVTADFLDRGFTVRAIVRPESVHEADARATVVRAPLKADALGAAFTGAEAVVHLAGVIEALSESHYTAVNVTATSAVARAAAAAGAHLVHVSSLAAAGPAPIRAPRDEDDEPNPLTPYGRSKLDGERAVNSVSGLSWTILRPGVVYGPGDRAMFLFFKCAALGVLPHVGRRDAAYMFVHVDDVVRTIAAAVAARSSGSLLFVSHPRPATAREVLEGVRLAVNRRAVVLRVPQPVTALAAALCDLAGRGLGRPLPLNRWRYLDLSAEGFVCRVDRLRERLGIVAALGLNEGFAQTAEWYRREGWIRR